MTLDKLIYDIREATKDYSDDSEVDDRFIIYLYNIKRAKYLRQDLNNYQKTADNSIQQTFCEEVEVISADTCGLDLSCETLLRTKRVIPKPIELSSKTAIIRVKAPNHFTKPFDFITKDKFFYAIDAPFPNGIYSFLDDDGYIYIYSGDESYKLIDCISITGVFEDPLELGAFNDCCGCDTSTTCFDEYSTDYPLQPHYIDLIRQEIIADILRTFEVPEDKENDAEDS